jgi:hypothetical protein
VLENLSQSSGSTWTTHHPGVQTDGHHFRGVFALPYELVKGVNGVLGELITGGKAVRCAEPARETSTQ